MSTTPVHIREVIRSRAENDPDSVALRALNRTALTYRALLEHVAETGRALRSFGVRSSDRVAVVLENGPELASAFLSISANAAYAPLNPSYRAAEYEFYLGDLDPAALIVAKGSESPAIAVARSLQIPLLGLSTDQSRAAGTFSLIGLDGDPGSSPADTDTHARQETDPPEIDPEAEALVLHTSGTTSRPKMVPLTHRNLCVSASNICRTLNLTPDDRCLNVMPLFHIHGLVGVLLSSVSAGASVVCTPGFLAPRFFTWMEQFGPTWYSAVPTMHQAILERAGENSAIIESTSLRFIRSSSASLPPKVMHALEDTFSAPVVEAYGMTEASHQMACNPLPPRERKPGSVGPAAGPEIAIMDNDGRLLETGETGEIVIRGENVTTGYAGNSEANASAFTNGWFRTGDEGRLDADRYLFITGRIKEIINRGGEKIAPREIDEVLLDHPGVQQAVAFAVPDERLGEDVAAAIVRATGCETTAGELRRFAAERLAHFKVPREIVFVDEIPKGPTGKLQRVGLAGRLAVPAVRTAAGAEQDVPPQSRVEKMVADLWREVLDLDTTSVNTRFLDAGGDSMTAMQLASRVRETFEIDVMLIDFFEAPTIALQARLIEDVLLEQ